MEELMNTGSTVITYTDYDQYKAELDAELQKSAESFVRIGYLLKVARDTGILKDSGYANVNDFAYQEYGLDKTQVSRFMNINDRFSEDGYSETLKTEYKGFGYAKLAIMLLLPDAITEELLPEYSKTEIQAIKEEYAEEQKITDLEVMMEEKDQVQQALNGTLQQAVWQIGKGMPELYVELWESLVDKQESEKDFMEHLAPSGSKTYMTRIPGKGRMMLMVKEKGEEIKLINLRDESDKQSYTKTDLVEAFRCQFMEAGDAETSWSANYGMDFPKEKTEVAPVQPKSAPKKESKVVKTKPAETPKPAPKEPEPAKTQVEKPSEEPAVQQEAPPAEQMVKQEGETLTLHDVDANLPAPDPAPQEAPEEIGNDKDTEESEEQQLPGQDSIENHPEYMPDTGESAEKLQTRAYELAYMSLGASMSVWKNKQMPLEAVQRNKGLAKELLEVLTRLEALKRTEEETEQ